MGSIVAGKVTGITKFGAFVGLAPGKTGMVHISEVAHTYVSDINEHLKEGQEITVKIIGIDQEGRINLSIKKATEPPARERKPERSPAFSTTRRQPFQGELTFEDKLKQFMQSSDSKMSDLKHQTDKRGRRGRGR